MRGIEGSNQPRVPTGAWWGWDAAMFGAGSFPSLVLHWRGRLESWPWHPEPAKIAGAMGANTCFGGVDGEGYRAQALGLIGNIWTSFLFIPPAVSSLFSLRFCEFHLVLSTVVGI